jgi:hypothetical protein
MLTSRFKPATKNTLHLSANGYGRELIMSIGMGYRVPGSTRGQAFTLPDFCYGVVSETDANDIAEEARLNKDGAEPTWQSVRGALIRLARTRCGK